MPEKKTLARAKRDAEQGKAASTQAGEFVREEIHHVREGKHGARSAKQAIAIGLSKARRAGVKLPPRPGQGGRKKESVRHGPVSTKRASATLKALRKEPRKAASHRALARHAHESASRHSPAERHTAAMKAVRTKGSAGRSRAARKAAKTRSHAHV